MSAQIRKALAKYMPERALDQVMYLFDEINFQLNIKKPRLSKYGDYRPPDQKHPYHRISVNGDMNKYAFLITFIHEIAHLITFEKFGHKVNPHGKEWKNVYSRLLNQYVEINCFPDGLIPALKRHIANPGASSCVDEHLIRALRKYDEQPKVLLENLPIGARFYTPNGLYLVKGRKRRTRYLCKEVKSGVSYTVSGIAEVMPEVVE